MDETIAHWKHICHVALQYTHAPMFQQSSEDKLRFRFLQGSVIAVEGIIGAGKTTLGESMASFLNGIGIKAYFLDEPGKTKILDLFYKDMEDKIEPNRYALTLQVDMLRQCQMNYFRAKQMAERENAVVIVDRTVWGNTVFAMMHLKGAEFEAYSNCLSQHAPYVYDYVLYVDISPEKAHKLITCIRKRKAELHMPLSYLYELERAYYIQLCQQVEAKQTRVVVISNEVFYDGESALDHIVTSETAKCRNTNSPKRTTKNEKEEPCNSNSSGSETEEQDESFLDAYTKHSLSFQDLLDHKKIRRAFKQLAAKQKTCL